METDEKMDLSRETGFKENEDKMTERVSKANGYMEGNCKGAQSSSGAGEPRKKKNYSIVPIRLYGSLLSDLLSSYSNQVTTQLGDQK